MKENLLDSKNSINNGLWSTSTHYVGQYITSTGYIMEQPYKKVSDSVEVVLYGGLYYNNNGFLSQVNNLTIDGKETQAGNANVDKVKNNMFLVTAYQGGLDTLYHRPLGEEIATEYKYERDERLANMFSVIPFENSNYTYERKVQAMPLASAIAQYSLCLAYVNNESIVDGGGTSITTGNDIAKGQELTLLRKVDTDGNIQIENIYTEAKAGQIVIAVVDESKNAPILSNRKKKMLWIRFVDPYVKL